MTKPKKPPTPGEIKSTLKKARKILNGRDKSYDLTSLFKNRRSMNIVADAVVDGTLELPVGQLRVVYEVLSDSANLEKLASVEIFEKGREARDETIRERSEAALASRALETSEIGALVKRVQAHIAPAPGPTPLPTEFRRWSTAEISEALGASSDDVEAAMEALIATNGGSRVAFARRHLDGRYSFTARGVFEDLRYPSAFEIERLVSEADFKSLNQALAAVGAKRASADRSAPKLVWRDGTRMTIAAQSWILVHMRTKGGFTQRSDRDAHKAVLNVLDLLRDTLAADSARDFAGWVVAYEGKGAPRCLVPHPAAFEEVARRALAGAKVSAYVLYDVSQYRLGRRALLRAEIAWPQFRRKESKVYFERCHDAWPTPEELGALADAEAEAWDDIADRFLADAAEAERTFPWSVLAERYLAHAWMGPKVRRYAMVAGGDVLDVDGLPEGANPGAVTLRTQASTVASNMEAPPKDETWEQRARRMLAAKLEGRARVPDFSRMAPFAKTRFKEALRPLGFAFELDDVSTGAVHRHLMRAERVLVRVAPAEGGLVVDRVTVEQSPYRRAHAERGGEGLALTGDWDMATDFEVATIGKALAALGFEAEASGSATSGWEASFSYSQNNDKRTRCVICRRKVEEFQRLAMRFAREPKPVGSAVREWEKHLIFVGPIHMKCGHEHAPELLAGAVAEREAEGLDISVFGEHADAGASLGQGPLMRCDRCRRPIKKGQWRLLLRGEAIHVACAREHHAEALEGALAKAPAGYRAE